MPPMAADPVPVSSLPHAGTLSEFCSGDGPTPGRPIPEELKSVVEVIALTGLVWHSWPQVRTLLNCLMGQVLDEYDSVRRAEDVGVGPPKPLASGETYPELKERLSKALDTFQDGPPFTVQRLCELLLNPKQHSNLHRLSFALEKVLLVTSCAPSADGPFPEEPLTASQLEALYALPLPAAGKEGGATEEQAEQEGGMQEEGGKGIEGGEAKGVLDTQERKRVEGEEDRMVLEEGVMVLGVAAEKMEEDEDELMDSTVATEPEPKPEPHPEAEPELEGMREGEPEPESYLKAEAEPEPESAFGGVDSRDGREDVMSCGGGSGSEMPMPGEVQRQGLVVGQSGLSTPLRLGDDVEVSGAIEAMGPEPPDPMDCLPEVGYAMGEPGPLPADIGSGSGECLLGSSDGNLGAQGPKGENGTPDNKTENGAGEVPKVLGGEAMEGACGSEGGGSATDEEADRVVAEFLLDACEEEEQRPTLGRVATTAEGTS